MAVITTEFTGLDLELQVDSNVIGGKDDATITLSRDASELPPNAATGSVFGRSLVGLRDAQIAFNALWIANSAALNGFKPTLDVGPVSPATTTPTLKGVTEVVLSFSRDMVAFNNDTHAGWRARRPSVVRCGLSVSLDYFDPESSNGAAYKQLQDAFQDTAGEADISVQLPGGNTSFDAKWVITEIPIGGGNSDAVNNQLAFQSNGDITETINSNLGTGLDTLLTNILADTPSAITALFTTTESGNTEYTGDFYPSEIEITIPVASSEDGVTVSGTLLAADETTIQTT